MHLTHVHAAEVACLELAVNENSGACRAVQRTVTQEEGQ